MTVFFVDADESSVIFGVVVIGAGERSVMGE